ncbi:MAG TPA: cyclic pyranopterin monophosphate synthase MoaC, partial [Candidatus Paceibacterota bacterium]|nr:cyclic pyranopterin monophosphate synthase MoaC [Candidatus Paceibacterota bacterium]
MRDISHKYSTLRTARARAVLTLKPETLRKLREGRLPKGDPLPVARVAAIQAAKNTSQIIPYCHPVPLDFVGISFSLGADRIEIEVTA